MEFRLVSSYKPQGDQGKAIESMTRGVFDGDKHQVLLGVTGSGKTYSMAKVIERVNRPALILAHNKTLAAKLYHEFKGFLLDMNSLFEEFVQQAFIRVVRHGTAWAAIQTYEPLSTNVAGTVSEYSFGEVVTEFHS